MVRRTLNIDDKRRLARAVADVEVMSDPARRQSLLRELKDELGADFDPARFTAGNADSWEIVTACLRLDAVPAFVGVLELLGGRTRAWLALERLVGELFAGGPGPAGTVSRIRGDVPRRNPAFTGRVDSLHEVRRALDGSIVTLHGLAGVGKSQIAIEFAHRFGADYDLVWWVPADDEGSIRRSLRTLARTLGADHPRSLIVFDNATEPSAVRPYLPHNPGHVLVTSRSRSWVSSSSMVEVEAFRPGETVEFLTRRWAGLSDDEARQLGTTLGHLPLALDQALAVHEQTGMPVREYLRIFAARPVQLLAESPPTDYPLPVATTWRRAFEQLQQRSLAAAQLLQLCAFLGSHSIPVPMLRAGRDAASLPAELAEALHDELKFRTAVREIGKDAFVKLDPTRDVITVHLLVRTVLRDTLTPQQRDEVRRGAHEVLALATRCPASAGA